MDEWAGTDCEYKFSLHLSVLRFNKQLIFILSNIQNTDSRMF
jgi:hypothetical protein